MYYPAEVVQYMLGIGAIHLEDCKMSLEASKHYLPEQLARNFETIRQCFASTCYNYAYSEYQTKKLCKQAILSIIGLWNSTKQHAWTSICSSYQSDAGQNVKMKRDLGDGSYRFRSSVEL